METYMVRRQVKASTPIAPTPAVLLMELLFASRQTAISQIYSSSAARTEIPRPERYSKDRTAIFMVPRALAALDLAQFSKSQRMGSSPVYSALAAQTARTQPES